MINANLVNKPEYEVYNPHNKSIEELPFIIGFNNGGSERWYYGCLISQDGHSLGSHICSYEGYMYIDLGITKGSRPDRHETFKQHYPDGYRMDFVSYKDIPSHELLNKAIELNKLLHKPEDTVEEKK